MPTYDFRCPKGHVFEKFYRNMSEALLTVPCPKCDAAAERQMSGGAGLVFKGSGFYSTDYGKNAHRKVAPAASGEGNKSDGAGESGGERKVESSADKPSTGSDSKSDSKGEGKPAESKPSESKSNAASGKESGSE
ncbi:MAG: zinc ribbon domain-containing protein [Anaerolineae bacterium]|nr:zinc ribbon domain-containing protein [Gemmatimonadaceae bacterium]